MHRLLSAFQRRFQANAHILFACLVLCLLLPGLSQAAEGETGPATPEKALEELAQAVRQKDVDAFRAITDVDALFDAPFAVDHKKGEPAWIMPFRQQKIDAFIEGIASGTYVLECRDARRPGCPWYPEGIEWAQVTMKDNASAIAAVDSVEGVRTWLVLHKTPKGWKVTAAPDRLKDAEFYARAAFQKALAAYQADVRKRLRKEAEAERRYQEGLVAAKEKAVSILSSIRVDSINAFIEPEATDSRLKIVCMVGSDYTEPVRLSRLRLHVWGKSGEEVWQSDFLVNTRFIEPGGAIQVDFSTRIDAENYEAALCLDNGGCFATARAVYVLVGKGNLHVDEDGGGLKPRRQ